MRNLRRAELETGVLTVEVREAAFPLEELCDFAARNNRKRGFLFLSKVLGKHWPAVPTTMRRVHAYLASKLDLGPGPWLFVAMAETATGLGQGIFEAVLDQHAGANALFLHSTRYRIPGRRFFQFEESHCHAPDQYLYEPLDADQRNVFRNAHELVIVDDEISTGSTLCNLVDTYRAHNPGLARVHFVAITNFSGERCAERFSARLGLPVQCVAALHGAFSFQSADEAYAENTAPAFGANVCEPGFVADRLGRFGIDRQLHVPVDDIRGLVAGLEPPARVLVLGTGEFMHVAFRTGLELEAMGFDVAVQATTRSPILPGAGIGRRLVFADNYGEGIPNYLYNVDPSDYARIIVCHETPPDGLTDLLRQLGPACVPYRYTEPAGLSYS